MAIPPRRIPKRITGLDSRIFANLFKAQRPLPIKQIAQRNSITWPTANLHIQKLAKFNVVDIAKTIRKNRVSINPNFLIGLNRKNLLKNEIKKARGWLRE